MDSARAHQVGAGLMFTDEELVLVEQEADRWMVLLVGRKPKLPAYEGDGFFEYEYSEFGPWSQIETELRAKAMRRTLAITNEPGCKLKLYVWPEHRVRWVISTRRRKERT